MTDLPTLYANWRRVERAWKFALRLSREPNTTTSSSWLASRHATADRALDALTEAAREAGWTRDQGDVLTWVAARINEQPEQTEHRGAA